MGAAPEPQGELRDPRRVNHITHSGYTAAAASRDAADLKLHEWLEAFPGRVEGVQGGKLYMVRLDEQDGEFKLGLVQSEGKIFSKPVAVRAGAEAVAHDAITALAQMQRKKTNMKMEQGKRTGAVL